MTTTAAGTTASRSVARWRTSVLATFWLSGFAVASWLARVPAVRDDLRASTFAMGVLGLGISAGSVLGFAVARWLAARVAARRVIGSSLVVVMIGLLVAGTGSWLGSYAVALTGLVLLGLGNGTCNVTMNIEGSAIEHRLRRPIMPWFHALYSVGAAIGVGAGALAAALGVPPALHMVAVVIVCAALWPLAVRGIRTGVGASDSGTAPAGAGDAGSRATPAVRSAWLEPRTLAIGLVVVGMSFANGAGNDWIALGMVDGHGTNDAVAALATTVFTIAVVAARIVGVPVLARLGRTGTVRVSAVFAVVGLLVFVAVPVPGAAFVGVALWGLGVALAFPIGMSAAGDDPVGAASRIAVVAAIGYAGSLTGPPLIGLVAEGSGILHALIVVVVFVAAAGVAATVLRGDRGPDARADLGAGPEPLP